MKKLLSTLMVIACLALAIPAQAQIKFGVKAGLNVSKLHLSEETFSSDNRAGFFVGPTAEFTLPLLGLGIDGSVLYNQFGVDSEEGTSTKKSIEIPINLRWTVGFSSLVGAYVAVGPQFGFNVGDRWFDEVCEFKKNTTSFNVGAGLKLLGHLQVGANYNFALKDNGKIHSGDIEDLTTIGFKQNTWQVSVAYLF
ncbi:MAG: porin family protein [Phocaeicola plebeius]